MCLAVPGRVVSIGSRTEQSISARVDLGDHIHDVDLVMTPEADVGDFVIVHSGYALRSVPPAEALAARRLLGVED